MRPLIRLLVLAFSAAASIPAIAGPTEEAALMALLRAGGQVVLMRNTRAVPGGSDPPDMSSADCATQRNLSEEGRLHAKAIGEKLRAAGIRFDRVSASPLCRCKETARLVFGRTDEVLSGTTRGEREVREMRFFAGERRPGNAILVSHRSTIRQAVNVVTDPGDMVVLTPHGDGTFEVRGKLTYPVP